MLGQPTTSRATDPCKMLTICSVSSSSPHKLSTERLSERADFKNRFQSYKLITHDAGILCQMDLVLPLRRPRLSIHSRSIALLGLYRFWTDSATIGSLFAQRPAPARDASLPSRKKIVMKMALLKLSVKVVGICMLHSIRAPCGRELGN